MPVSGDSISVSTFSVATSQSVSPSVTVSPTCLAQAMSVAVSMLARCGSGTSMSDVMVVVMSAPQQRPGAVGDVGGRWHAEGLEQLVLGDRRVRPAHAGDRSV